MIYKDSQGSHFDYLSHSKDKSEPITTKTNGIIHIVLELTHLPL